MLHTKYQVVYPFPTFQPAFQLKKDQVVLLNTSYSLVACAVAVHAAGTAPPGPPLHLTGTPPFAVTSQLLPPPGDSSSCQILYERRSPPAPCRRAGCVPSRPEEPGEREGAGTLAQPLAGRAASGDGQGRAGTGLSPAVAKAKEFVADIFRRAKEATGPALAGSGGEEEEDEEEDGGGGTAATGFECRPPPVPAAASPCSGLAGSGRCRLHPASPRGDGSPPGEPTPTPGPLCAPPAPPPEPGYVNYTKLRYVLEPGEPAVPEEGELPVGRLGVPSGVPPQPWGCPPLTLFAPPPRIRGRQDLTALCCHRSARAQPEAAEGAGDGTGEWGGALGHPHPVQHCRGVTGASPPHRGST